MAYRPRPRRTSKDRALAQLRGYWEPQDVSKYLQDSESAVAKTLKGLGLKDRFNEDQVFDAWNHMVDEFAGENAGCLWSGKRPRYSLSSRLVEA